MLKNTKLKKCILLSVLLVVLIAVSLAVFAADEPVSISVNGPRLVAKLSDGSTPASCRWSISDTADGAYTVISGATGVYYDISAADEGKYIKVSVNGTESQPVGPIGKLVVMDIGKGSVSLGTTYSGKDSDGNTVSGTHAATNIYVIVHKNNATKTTNNISFSGNLANKPFDVTLSGVNMGATPTNHNQSPGLSGSGTLSGGQINIPATSGNVKKVTLRLKGENVVRYISYYVGGDTRTPTTTSSSLKITNINGDGAVEGGSLYVPIKLAPNEIEDFVKTKTNYNHWNAGIGGTDGSSLVQNLHIAGGFIQVATTLGDNCTAIGAGGNGYCHMEISGGEVVAHCNGTGAAIGGGIGWNAAGGVSNVIISGGKVYAKNHGNIPSGSEIVGGVAIGSGSSFYAEGSKGQVTIKGGTVEAYGTFGNGIGGGNSSTKTGGKATISISGGTVSATSIGGGNSKAGTGGEAEVTVSGSAAVTLINGIGGGLSESGTGGQATIAVNGGTMTCGGVIGGGNGGADGNGGKAIITVTSGTLISQSIGGGIGGIGGNGGAAEIYISGETSVIKTGSIGGGSTLNTTNGKLGYAKAEISGGDVSGQFIMAAGGTEACTFKMTGGKLHGVDTRDTSQFTYTKENGAAVYMDDPSGRVEISAGTITDCYAVNGGAVYMTAGTFILSGGTIEDCHATENGGGIYLGGGNMTVSSGKLTDNTAKNGGAAYVNALSVDDGVFVSGGEISSNIAQTNGGGIAVNNGFYKMTGGTVDGNEATDGYGGGIYVAASGVDVLVDIRSGSVSGNTAGTSGGAVAVVGRNGGEENITVTVGVNKTHYDGNGRINCDHDYEEGGYIVEPCPVLNNNLAVKTGGAVYITGGKTTALNVYCLEESGNLAADGKVGSNGDPAADGKSKSNFMMVDGGTVIISTAENNEIEGGDAHGNITINNTIHIFAGDMTLYGSMNNPKILSPLTVDVTTERGSYYDYRTSDGTYYKLQYFENFTDPDTGVRTGQYTVYQIKHGDSHQILASIYQHDGYVIDGWWTSEFGDSVADSIEYLVNESYTFTNQSEKYPGDLKLYAKWLPVGYYVYFDPGTTDSYRGTMETVRYNYDTENELPANLFFRPGWLFDGWDADGDGDAPLLEDMATVKNLTTERGITLVAVWVLCTHTEDLFEYSVSADGASLIRSCYCEKCTQTATIIAEDTVYVDGNTTPYDADVRVVTSATNGVQPGAWELTETYAGVKYDNTALSPEPFLIGAGEYSVSITDGGKTATVYFEIKKADRTPPAKPEYKSNETDQSIEKGKIFIKDPNDTSGAVLEYRVLWHVEGGASLEKFADLQEATTDGIVLGDNYTNYYVYVRYEGDDNHNASEWVRADAVLFYTGDVYIFINAEDGIDYNTEAKEADRGLVIKVWATDGNYLYDTEVSDNNDQTIIKEEDVRQKYYISDIPQSTDSAINIYVTIKGVKKAVKINTAVDESEVFGKVTGNSATVTRDSAYTAYFEIQNYALYENPSLNFGRELPAGTTIILVDKSATPHTFWSYKVGIATNTVPLSDFKQMGAENKKFAPPETSDITLKYQIIVDFSDSVGGCDGDSITTTLSANVSTENADKGTPTFPENPVSVNLKDVPSSSVTVSDSDDSISKNVHVEYLNVTDGATASKWNGRTGALILTPTVTLPADARIKVVDLSGYKTEYYLNANGQFIIALPEGQTSDLTMTLLSDLFPDGEAVYTFQMTLYGSCSSAAAASMNGTELIAAQQTVTFIKETDAAEPSLKIEGEERVYGVGDTVKVNVDYQNLPEHTVLVLKLFSKDTTNGLSSNTYVDTGWKQQTETVKGENSVPLGNLTGSCRIDLELRDTAGNVITSVSYYFVIRE